MPSTYSPSLRLELMGAGEQAANWNNTTNYNLGTLLEQAIAGVESVSISGASYTLTTGSGIADQARNAVLVLTGALTGNCNVIVPSVKKIYTVRNSTTGGFSVVVKTFAGTGVNITPGDIQTIYCDGTNVQGPVGGVPTGAVMEYFGPVAPAGWLLINGAAVSRTVYASLFSLLGTTYGSGDGVTTFNLPNRTDRFGVGAGGFYPVGAVGGGTTTSTAGSHSHGSSTGSTTLTIAQMPAHNHSINDPGHAHSTIGVANDGNFGAGGFAAYPAGTTNTAGSSTGITINNQGGGGGHDHSIAGDGSHNHTITPPYLASNYIIKT